MNWYEHRGLATGDFSGRNSKQQAYPKCNEAHDNSNQTRRSRFYFYSTIIIVAITEHVELFPGAAERLDMDPAKREQRQSQPRHCVANHLDQEVEKRHGVPADLSASCSLQAQKPTINDTCSRADLSLAEAVANKYRASLLSTEPPARLPRWLVSHRAFLRLGVVLYGEIPMLAAP